MSTTITTDDIRTLRTESSAAGDHAMALICDLATGDVVIDEDTTMESLRISTFLSAKDKRRISALDADSAREECERVILAAAGLGD